MKIRTTYKSIIFLLLLLFSSIVSAAIISRVKTWSDGEVLTSADLNTEFDNVVDGVNAISNDNITTNAAIAPSKISAAIKGSAIDRNSTTGALSVKVDDVGIEISGDELQIKANGITGANLNADVVDDVTLQYSSSELSIKDDGVSTVKIADEAVTFAKREVRDGSSSTAGIGDVAIDSSTPIFSTSSSSFQDTGHSVTITTNGGPVRIALIVDPAAGGVNPTDSAYTDGIGILRFSRDATPIGAPYLNSTSNLGYTLEVIDTPAAGTYTYTTDAKAIASTISINNMRLVAYEL